MRRNTVYFDRRDLEIGWCDEGGTFHPAKPGGWSEYRGLPEFRSLDLDWELMVYSQGLDGAAEDFIRRMEEGCYA